MKILLIAITLVIFSSCHDEPKSYDESREIIPNPEGHKKDSFIQAPVDSIPLSDSIK